MRKSLFFLAALTLLAVGCNKENGPDGGSTSGTNTKVSATIADNETSAWRQGQNIFLNAGTGAYTYNGTAAANTAEFEGAAYSIPAEGLFGAYVGDQTTAVTANAADVSMTFNVPSQWTYDAENAPMGTMVAYSKDSNLKFHNLGGCLSFKLYGDAELEGPQPCIESIVVFGAKGEAVSGEATVKFTSGGAIKGVSYNSNLETSITMDMSKNPLQLDPDTPVEILIPFAAGAYEKGIYFEVYTDDDNYMKRTEELVTVVERGEVAEVPEYVFVADPKPTNLSANGYANCYIIPQEATAFYSFDATVIGNGDEGLCEGAHVTTTKIAPKGAKILWKIISSSKVKDGEEQPIVTKTVKLERDGMVTFRTHTHPGNAVIAVYDNEECTGEPLWTWHFWKPEGALEAVKDIVYNETYTLMNMNLGSIQLNNYPDNISGMYYQWGRKDPFFHANGVAVTATGITLVANNATDGDVAYTVANPMAFITSVGAANFENNDWLPNAAQNDKLWGTKKTIYDPCPAGYRVADAAAFELIVSSDPTIMEASTTAAISGGGTSQLQYTLGGVNTQFPCCGYLLYDAGKRHDRNKSGRIWTVNAGTTDADKSTAFSYNTTGDAVAMIEAERALAHPVRCQKIK